jgi:hypothetical protein
MVASGIVNGIDRFLFVPDDIQRVAAFGGPAWCPREAQEHQNDCKYWEHREKIELY